LQRPGTGFSFASGKAALKPNNLVIEVKQRFELSDELLASAVAVLEQPPQLAQVDFGCFRR